MTEPVDNVWAVFPSVKCLPDISFGGTRQPQTANQGTGVGGGETYFILVTSTLILLFWKESCLTSGKIFI
jgi:hypothetical protein